MIRLRYIGFLFMIIIVFYTFSGGFVYGAKITIVGHYIPGVPYVMQEDPYWCGPACLTMVLRYWGVNITQKEIAAEIYDPVTHLTYISDMEEYPRRFNFTVESMFSDIDELKELIKNGYPVIVLQKYSLTDTYGHFRVVLGYNDRTKIIMTNDPLRHANYTIEYSVFKKLWEPGATFSTTNWTLLIYKPGENPPQTPIPIYGTEELKDEWLVTTLITSAAVILVLTFVIFIIKIKKRHKRSIGET